MQRNRWAGDGLTGEAGGTGQGESAASMRAALNFVAAIRRDAVLRDAVATAVAAEEGLRAIVAVAARFGYEVGVDELRAAFATDWGMRRAYYLREVPG
jgi:hypothetical protein